MSEVIATGAYAQCKFAASADPTAGPTRAASATNASPTVRAVDAFIKVFGTIPQAASQPKFVSLMPPFATQTPATVAARSPSAASSTFQIEIKSRSSLRASAVEKGNVGSTCSTSAVLSTTGLASPSGAA